MIIFKVQPDLNMLQSVDLIGPPTAGLWLDVQSDHTSWRNDSNQKKPNNNK